jgi:hypothetical protein
MSTPADSTDTAYLHGFPRSNRRDWWRRRASPVDRVPQHRLRGTRLLEVAAVSAQTKILRRFPDLNATCVDLNQSQVDAPATTSAVPWLQGLHAATG